MPEPSKITKNYVKQEGDSDTNYSLSPRKLKNLEKLLRELYLRGRIDIIPDT